MKTGKVQKKQIKLYVLYESDGEAWATTHLSREKWLGLFLTSLSFMVAYFY